MPEHREKLPSVYVQDERGRVVVAIHNPTPRTLARVLTAHPESEQLIRGELQRQIPDAYARLDNG